MAYGRYDPRRGWREDRPGSEWRDERPSSRWNEDREERGFFERAGDEIASWFGDDDAQQRRRSDERRDDYGARRPAAFISDEDGRFGRRPRFRDEHYRRPYTGLYGGADDDRLEGRPHGASRFDRGATQRGAETGEHLHDPHYAEWRRRQIDALDRDYEEYRRENQSRFEQEFATWRGERQTKRQLLSQVREQMSVVGADGEAIGTVDKVRGDRLILAKNDSPDGRHHSLPCTRIDKVEGDQVVLSIKADEAQAQWRDDDRERALFERDDQGEAGPMMLDRSFSGTYR